MSMTVASYMILIFVYLTNLLGEATFGRTQITNQ